MPSVHRKWLFYAALRLQGMNFGRDLHAAHSNQSLDHDALLRLQLKKLERVLRLAARQNKVYRQLVLARTAVDLDSISGDFLGSLPVVHKSDLAEIAATVQRRGHFPGPIVKRTSGSSGRPLALWKQRSGLSQELAATWRSYGWYGILPGAKHVRVWGRPLDWRKRALSTVKGIILNSKRISAFDVNERTLSERIAKIGAYAPTFVYGYASAVRELAEWALSRGLDLPSSIVAVITTAEPLDMGTRTVIESAFAAPCRDEYGCSEVGSIAHECIAGRLHLMADNLIAEVLQIDGKVSDRGFGELLITDLANELTPVIRYRVGDYCELDPVPNCPCGLQLPVVSKVLGRTEDTVVMPDGTRHHPAKICYLVDKVDTYFGIVKQYQVIQKTPRSFEIRVVTEEEGLRSEFESKATRLFQDELDRAVKVTVVCVSKINREPSGKFRLVVGIASPT